MGDPRTPAEVIADRLAAHVGAHAARATLRTMSEGVLGCRPEEVAPSDTPRLLRAMHPLLRVLLGQARADHFFEDVERELR